MRQVLEQEIQLALPNRRTDRSLGSHSPTISPPHHHHQPSTSPLPIPCNQYFFLSSVRSMALRRIIISTYRSESASPSLSVCLSLSGETETLTSLFNDREQHVSSSAHAGPTLLL